MLLFPAPAVAADEVPLETRIKAAMIYNFSRFIRWNDGVKEPLTVCVVKDSGMVQAINAVSDSSGREKRLARALRIEDPTTVRGCDAIYLPNGTESLTAMALQASRQESVLTIGDSLRFVENGGAMGFFLDNDRVRFAVSLSTLESAGLTVSSRLLSLAKVVDRRDGKSRR